MQVQTLTKAMMVSAIAISLTAGLSQSSSASRPEHPQPCLTGHSNNCTNQRVEVCDDENPCPVRETNSCNTSYPSNNCPQGTTQTCNTNLGNNCNTQPPVVSTPAPTAHTFFCSVDNGVPTTFVTTQGRTYPVVRWVSNYFSPHGYEPLTRCRQVSAKFQQFYNNGTLNYITTGTVNRQPVICVSNAQNGACTGVLFTLKPEENANRIIQQLFDIRSGAAGPLEESGDRIYFDMKKYLNNLIGTNGNGSRTSQAQQGSAT